jgi:hypothetical protein
MLSSHPELSDRKRFRDRHRYFQKLEKRAAAYDLYMEPDMWWYYHHEHLDWMGRGNIRWVYRCQTIRAHLILMHRIVQQLAGFKSEFQAWLSIRVPDATNDAVYPHSPNPESPFPANFSGTNWDHDAVPIALRELGPSNMFWGREAEGGFCGFLEGVGVNPRS